jgi:hypothetical protein
MQTAIDSIHATSIPPDFFLQSSARLNLNPLYIFRRIYVPITHFD